MKRYTFILHGLTWLHLQSMKTETLTNLKIKSVQLIKGLLRPATKLIYST